MKNEIIPSFKETLFNSTREVVVDFLEIGIDQLIDNQLIKDFPIIGTIVKLGDSVISIRDRFLLRKTLIFINEINNNKISKSKLEKHKNILEENPNMMRLELEHIIILLDRQFQDIKHKLLANLYMKYIDEDLIFDWYDFCYFAEILDKFSIYDINTLKDIYYKKAYSRDNYFDTMGIARLSSIGLVEYSNNDVAVFINSFGESFYEKCINE